MDYSLQILNKTANLKTLTLEQFVEKLNLIGLEVDNISYEKMFSNVFFENIRVLLKIPANREDLLNEKFFLKELSTIFLIEIYDTWENLKFNYFSLIQEKYTQYKSYKFFPISRKNLNVITYIIEVENAQLNQSPNWITEKLLNVGIEPYNNVTDILNLVFSEWGQPINILPTNFIEEQNEVSFEIDCLNSNEYYFNEKNQKILLSSGTFVLKDQFSKKILNVMGSLRSKFEPFEQEKMFSFLLETSFYDISTNSQLLNSLISKAYIKDLRRSSLQNFRSSFQRVLTLLELLTSCKILAKKYSTINENFDLKTTKLLCLKKINLLNFLNIKIPDPLIFSKAGLKIVCETPYEYYFKIPVYRHDLQREIDIIEEYTRFVGFKNFKEILPEKTVFYTKNLLQQKYFIKNFFVTNGFSEVITNPIADLKNQSDSSVLINNPLNTELSTLRRSLIPKLLEVLEMNSRLFYPKTDFFEIGRTFKIVKGKILEQEKLAGIFQLSSLNYSRASSSDWFVAKGLVENFLFNFGYKNITTETILPSNSFFHPNRTVIFRVQTKILGVFGELHPFLRKEKYSHIRKSIYIFELNKNYLKEWKLTTFVNFVEEYSKYPSIIKDLSINISKSVDVDQLVSFISLQSIYLKRVKVFDIYFDEKVGHEVNLGIRLEFQSKTETLTNEIIEFEIEKIKSVIENYLKSF